MLRAALALLTGLLATAPMRAQAGPSKPAPPATRKPAPPAPAPTPRLLLDLASGKQRLADLIDPALGLWFIDHFEGPGEDGNTMEDLHVCPRELDKLVQARWASVVDEIRSSKETAHLTCAATPQPTCRAGGAGEWDPVFHFSFGTRGSGAHRTLVLRAIAIDDEVLVDPDHLAVEHARQAKLLAQPTRCP